MPLKAEAWFPSLIWSGLLDNTHNDKIKKFGYERKEQDEGVELSNYIGWQSSSVRQGDNETFDRLVESITSNVEDCRNLVELPELQLYNIWININTPGAYNALHNHPGSVLSGVYYVESTEEQGNIFFERGDNAEYFLPPVKQTNYFNGTATSYKAITGAMYVFPSWLKHSVQPNKTDKDRISISFNLSLIHI